MLVILEYKKSLQFTKRKIVTSVENNGKAMFYTQMHTQIKYTIDTWKCATVSNQNFKIKTNY